MDKVLVVHAAGHRSTGEVALAIGDQLTRTGLHVDVRPFPRAGAAGKSPVGTPIPLGEPAEEDVSGEHI